MPLDHAGELNRLGATRSRRAPDHLLHTPDAFVYAPLPGMRHATAAIHAAPGLGAAFTQYTAVIQRAGMLGEPVGTRFVFVMEGSVEIEVQGKSYALEASGYALLPQDEPHTVTGTAAETRVAVIEKPYVAQQGVASPSLLIGSEASVAPTPLMGDDALQVRTLLPADAALDFAVNTMEYQPGASLSMVEVHVMEHGLVMLEGEGIYRLGDAWYPVAKGDFIWMGPYCPQWFGALGKRPSKYLIYKNWNRHPALEVR